MAMHIRSHGRGRTIAIVTMLLILFAMSGCASRFQMTELWKDPSYAGSMHNVLVVALRSETIRRRLWEDAFTQDLKGRGVTATPSYQIFPTAPPDTQDVIDVVRKNGYDTVIASVRLPNETERTYVPGAVRREAVTVRDFIGRFHTYWQDVQDPGHVEVDEVRTFQTDVWATGDGGRIVWSATLRTLESVSNDIVHSAVSKHLIPTMENQGMVPKKLKD